jgi:hypothetical protein
MLDNADVHSEARAVSAVDDWKLEELKLASLMCGEWQQAHKYRLQELTWQRMS